MTAAGTRYLGINACLAGSGRRFEDRSSILHNKRRFRQAVEMKKQGTSQESTR
jgi:hypothetical protein